MLIRIAACVILIPWSAPATAFAQISPMTSEQLEAEGIEVSTSVPPAGMTATGTTLTGTVLLIPDSTTDVVAAFDPFDGHYHGDLINGLGILSTPINAIQGPDGNIYVSDQVLDAVLIFDRRGTMIGTYAAAGTVIHQVRTGSGWRCIEEAGLNGWTSLGNDLPGSLGSPVLLGDGVDLLRLFVEQSNQERVHLAPEAEGLLSFLRVLRILDLSRRHESQPCVGWVAFQRHRREVLAQGPMHVHVTPRLARGAEQNGLVAGGWRFRDVHRKRARDQGRQAVLGVSQGHVLSFERRLVHPLRERGCGRG